MKSFSRIFFVVIAAQMLCSCQTQTTPQIIPGIAVKRNNNHVLGTIGETEPVYLNSMSSPFVARIDTGAETSSIDASNVKQFERDGEKWVSFNIVNRETGEKKKFERPIERKSNIKRIELDEKRYVVRMEIKMGNQTMNEEFSLADRSKFDYQVLVGRNILTGRAVVDTALSNTLH